MSSYHVTCSQIAVAEKDTAGSFFGEMLKVGFGEPAPNTVIVKDAATAVEAAGLTGGKILLVNGPASLPVAFVLAHATAHRYGAVAVFDPKLSGYVVAVSHDPDFPFGSVIEATRVS